MERKLKITEDVKNDLYDWIMQHPQAVKLPMSNDCVKVNYDGHNKK